MPASTVDIAKHTPGPWRVVGPSSETCKPYMGCWTVEGETNVANMCTLHDARLIAATLDLLAALKGIAECVDGGSEDIDDWCEQARAAIAKAEGR